MGCPPSVLVACFRREPTGGQAASATHSGQTAKNFQTGYGRVETRSLRAAYLALGLSNRRLHWCPESKVGPSPKFELRRAVPPAREIRWQVLPPYLGWKRGGVRATRGQSLAGGEKIPAGNEIWIPAGGGDPFSIRRKGSPARPRAPTIAYGTVGRDTFIKRRKFCRAGCACRCRRRRVSGGRHSLPYERDGTLPRDTETRGMGHFRGTGHFAKSAPPSVCLRSASSAKH
jgi:hypothetical protein